MFNVLIVNNSLLDKGNYSDIIHSATSDIKVFTASNLSEAEDVLRQENIHLTIADVSQNSDYIQNVVNAAREHAPSSAILLTSVMRESELEQLALKFGVDEYLAKPISPPGLLEKVLPFVRKREEEEEVRGAKELHTCLRRLDAAINECSYREAMDIIRSSLGFIFDTIRDNEVVKKLVLAMAEGLCYTTSLDKEETAGLERQLNHLRRRIDAENERYAVLQRMQTMLDIIFDSFEKSDISISSDLKVLNFIERNITKGLKLDEVADYANMNSSYFSKYFKKMTGQNYVDYLTNRRIAIAADFLSNTDIPVSNIAKELSFHSTNYFSKVFKKNTGLTPSEYRLKS